MRFPQIAPLAAGVLVLAALGLAGCGSDSVGPSANSSAQVRAINALQGCPNIDIRQPNIQPIPFPNMSYGQILPNPVSATHAPLRAGTANYAVYQTGTTINPLVASTSVALDPHSPSGNANSGTYTLAAAGACGAASGSGTQQPQLIRLLDAFPTFTAGSQGTVALRVINLIADFPGTINLFSNGAGLNGTDNAGTNAVQFAGNPGVDTSHYNAGISLAGNPPLTIVSNSNAVLATVPSNLTFVPGHSYTLFVIGEVNPTGGGQAVKAIATLDN